MDPLNQNIKVVANKNKLLLITVIIKYFIVDSIFITVFPPEIDNKKIQKLAPSKQI